MTHEEVVIRLNKNITYNISIIEDFTPAINKMKQQVKDAKKQIEKDFNLLHEILEDAKRSGLIL